MNKGELISKVYEKNIGDIASRAAAERIVNTVFSEISETVVTGDPVRLDKFGTFELTKRSARNGVNPQTKEPMKIKATKAVRFKPAGCLKTAAAKSKAKI